MKNAFYEGELWKNELEAIAMPLIESYDVILCETSPGYVFDGPREDSGRFCWTCTLSAARGRTVSRAT